MVKQNLESIVKESRKQYKKDLWKERNKKIDLGKNYGFKYKLTHIEEYEPDYALYIILRTDDPIANELTDGQYMDYAAGAVIERFRDNINLEDYTNWHNSRYNRVILQADSSRRIADLVTFANRRNLPYRPIFRYFKKRAPKNKALIGVVIGPAERDVVNKATHFLPLF